MRPGRSMSSSSDPAPPADGRRSGCRRPASKSRCSKPGKPQGDADFTEHKPAFDSMYRDQANELMRRRVRSRATATPAREYNYDWFANDLEEPYTTPDGQAVQLAGTHCASSADARTSGDARATA